MRPIYTALLFFESRKTLINPLLVTILCSLAFLSHAESIIQNPELELEPLELGLDFVTIPAGQFVMGTTDIKAAIADLPEPGAEMIQDETPAHSIVFKKPFQLSRTEVTQKVWFDIMQTKPGPDKHWQHKNWQQLPVVSVSWLDANRFIDRLNTLSTSLHYRLPTEAEWEYAARAGSTGLRPFSKLAMDEYAWYINSSNDEIQAVAQLKANAWGLHDMYGNAWEWIADWYSPTTYQNAVTDDAKKINPQGPEHGTKRIRRGGSYHCPPHLIRSAYRAADSPDKAYSVLGFRLVAEEKK